MYQTLKTPKITETNEIEEKGGSITLSSLKL